MSYFQHSGELPAWIGNPPVGWGTDWLKWHVRLLTERPTDEEAEELPYIANEDISSWTGKLLNPDPQPADADSRKFRPDDILFNKLRPYLAKVYHASFAGVSSGELLCLRAEDRVLPRYLFYVVSSKAFVDTVNAETFGSKMPRADWETVGHQPLPLPAIETQKRIASFLDEKTAQIDALIENKRALLDRLAEKRQAIITHAVTKGLNHGRPMKNSGFAWLGQIPTHWEVRGLTKCTTRVDYRGATPEKSTSGVFLVTARNIKNGRIDYTLSEEFILEEDYGHIMRRGKPAIGDVLFTTEAPLGEVAHVDRTDVALAQRIIKFSSSIAELDNYYLGQWMQSTSFQFDLQSRATGSTALGIKASKIVELRCLIPPLREQREIVAYVQAASDAIDVVRNKVQTSIDHLSSYRSASVTEAVTGQIAELR